MSISGRIERIATAVRGMRRARADAPCERLGRGALHDLQEQRLAEIARFAVARSPLYREIYRGLDLAGSIDLAALPQVDKATLMDAFDDWVTDRRLRRAEVEAQLPAIEGGALHLGEYRVCATGGTSGVRGLFLYSRSEWEAALAGFFRYAQIVGTTPRLPRRRIAVITTVSPLHMSARYSQSTDFGVHRVLRLDARRPLAEIASRLEAFQPESLNGYPSVLALLADEQRAGRLRIAPSLVCSTSEVRTPEMEARIVEAWGVRPFDVYATTETGILAADCPAHRGMHLFEDAVIVENVDAIGRPVPDGVAGARLLVTNLWNRTQPIIRYELSDMVAMDSTPCPCGRTSRRVVAIDGRADDVLVLAARNGGTVSVHPLAVRSPFAGNAGVAQYQVRYDGRTLTVRVVPRSGDDAPGITARVQRDLATKLAEAGAVPPPICVHVVDAIQRHGGPSGKLKLIEVCAPDGRGDGTAAAFPPSRSAAPAA